MLIVTAGVKTNAFFQVEFCKKLFSRAAVLVFICLFSLYFFLEFFRYVQCTYHVKKIVASSLYFDSNNDAVLKTSFKIEETLTFFAKTLYFIKIISNVLLTSHSSCL